MSDEPKVSAVILTGPFEDYDLQLLAATLRIIDDRNPDRKFTMIINDQDSSLTEATLKMHDMLPEDHRRRTTISSYRTP